MTRFFMTILGAVHLVLQASVIGESGSTLILDMGTPVSVDYVARRLIKRSRKAVTIEYVGLRDGEKLHEVLVGAHESPKLTAHDRIISVDVSPIPWSDVESPERLASRWAAVCQGRS